MGRLIDEDIVIDIINFECGKWTGLSKTIEKEIKALPSAQPSNGACWGCQCEKVEKLQPEREKGKWTHISDGYVDIYECNQCGDTEDYERNFCPNCGADEVNRMGISKEKIQTVIENCFNAECNIATIHDAFERGFRAGMQEDVQPVVHGEWIPVDSYSAFGGDEATWMAHGNPIALHYCSECGKDAYAGEDGEELLTDFCPSCGADMRTKETDCDYERAVEQLEHDMLYEPTFNQDDGSM